MDDRLQRRLRDADPLTAVDGELPDPARLDAIKEQLMLSATGNPGGAPGGEAPRRRGTLRPRAIGVTAMAAAGLATVLVVGSLARPATSALAWDPSPTAVTAAQKAAAKEACSLQAFAAPGTAGAPVAGAPVVGQVESGTVTVGGPATAGGPTTVTGEAGADGAIEVTGQGVIVNGGGVLPEGLPEIAIPPVPSELPPLVYMEQHGSGAVAVFADKATTAYCLLVVKGDGYELAALQMPVAGGGAFGIAVASASAANPGAAGAGGPDAGITPVMSGMSMADADGLSVSAMTTTYGDQDVGIIAGTAPDGAATVEVQGGTADGAIASVTDGRFALWAPRALDEATTLIARDISGTELGRVTLDAPPAPPAPPANP